MYRDIGEAAQKPAVKKGFDPIFQSEMRGTVGKRRL